LRARFARDELNLMAFPCDQFGNQEPGTDDAIVRFARTHGFPGAAENIGDSDGFALFAKTLVNGPETVPAWRFLKNSKVGKGEEIRWNYAKFLVGRDGVPLAKYDAPFDLRKISKDVEAALERMSEAKKEYDSGF